jgi:hypothetical protein
MRLLYAKPAELAPPEDRDRAPTTYLFDTDVTPPGPAPRARGRVGPAAVAVSNETENGANAEPRVTKQEIIGYPQGSRAIRTLR